MLFGKTSVSQERRRVDPTVLRRDDERLRFFSTITTFGTPRDVTLEELRIECCFPVDEGTAALCRRLARESAD